MAMGRVGCSGPPMNWRWKFSMSSTTGTASTPSSRAESSPLRRCDSPEPEAAAAAVPDADLPVAKMTCDADADRGRTGVRWRGVGRGGPLGGDAVHVDPGVRRNNDLRGAVFEPQVDVDRGRGDHRLGEVEGHAAVHGLDLDGAGRVPS